MIDNQAKTHTNKHFFIEPINFVTVKGKVDNNAENDGESFILFPHINNCGIDITKPIYIHNKTQNFTVTCVVTFNQSSKMFVVYMQGTSSPEITWWSLNIDMDENPNELDVTYADSANIKFAQTDEIEVSYTTIKRDYAIGVY